jgi:allophanate hydrolase
MGLRLVGPRLAHGPGGANIVTDGVTPGAIQVPGDGQPILLRADGQTSGGYAKIGCVISADLDRMAQFCPGDVVRFLAVDHAQAARARGDAPERFAAWRQSVASARGGFDEGRLWSENLIGGAIFGE